MYEFESWSSGFWMTFDNGFKISAQWGIGMYCKNRGQNNDTRHRSPDAEVAVFNPKGEQLYIDGPDTVAGWVNPNQLVDLVNIVSSLKGDEINDENHSIKFR